MQNDHTSSQFDTEMETLRSSVLNMGGLVERQLQRALDAVKGGDSAPANLVMTDEQLVNEMQMNIDKLCAEVIARRQPAAGDLRTVIAVGQTVNDLERMGDEAKKIARKATEIYGEGASTRDRRNSLVHYSEIGHIGQLAQSMLQMALDAYARKDLVVAAEVVTRDKQVDSEFQAVMRQLISYMMEDPRTISSVLDVIFVAKSLERIGDHAKNIAEYVVQVVIGKDMRHATAEEIQREAAS